MTLKQWGENRWLRPHKTSRQEISELLKIVDRDLQDAGGNISADWQFGIAYNAALKLCTILLYAEGYRPERNLAHFRTIEALSEILGSDHRDNVEYLQSCRSKRNQVEYDSVGGVTADDARELVGFAQELREKTTKYLEKKHSSLLSK